MPVLPHFPPSLLREEALLWELKGVTVGGGESAGGQEALTRLDGGGLWKASLNGVALRTADHVRAWRALAAICDGGVQPVVVPMCDGRHIPAPEVNGVRVASLDVVPHSDGATFSDGSGYASSVVEASLAVAAVLRATSLTVTLTAGSALRGGEYFSIDHADLRWRLYRVRTAVDNGDGTFAVTIRPPLRAAVTAGSVLEFDRPKCVMRIASADAMDLMLEQRRRGRPSVSFVEAFPPFPE